MPGAGTRSSPITIDLEDIEDEREICDVLTTHTPGSATPQHRGSPVTHPFDTKPVHFSTEQYSYRAPSPDYGDEVQQFTPQDLNPNGSPGGSRKRRRSQSFDGSESEEPPNKQGRPLEERLTDPLKGRSKSSIKRYNKAQKAKRIQVENRKRLHHNPELGITCPPGYKPGDLIDPWLLLPPYPHVEPYALGPPTPSYSVTSHYSAFDEGPNFFPTPWVQSMAWSAASGLGMPYHNPIPSQHLPPEPENPPPNLPPMFIASSVAPLMTPSRPIPTGPKAEAHALPAKPLSQMNLSIGMKPDQDPCSKHGLFKLDMEKGKLYIPNPARTLVMEQLPKSHRNADFINSWGRKACGAQPVKVLIDPPASKALVEFATAELARKAWESPRLGAAFVGVKSHLLKGKPREDLIRVWWYRVDGIGAGSGVGEIEEGEIEGDAQEAEASRKKETKKERKARLAKERLDKANREQDAAMHKDIVLDASRPAFVPLHDQPPAVMPGNQYQPSTNTIRSASLHGPSVQLQSLSNGDTHADEDMDVEGEDMELSSPVHLSGPTPNIAPPYAGPSSPGGNNSTSSTTLTSVSSVETNPVPRPSVNGELKVLAARQKELEDKIARGRLELAQRQSTLSNAIGESPAPQESKQAMEGRLRERVLQSQKAKQLSYGHAKLPPSAPTPAFTVDTKTNSAMGVTTHSFSLDDLAVSFITQTIETAKVRGKTPPEPVKTTAPPPFPRTASNSKAELELRSRRLEQHIAETKALMAQMAGAKTRQEKDVFRMKLKELDKQRLTEERSAGASQSAGPSISAKPTLGVVVSQSCWPRFEAESNVLVLSDDEDD